MRVRVYLTGRLVTLEESALLRALVDEVTLETKKPPKKEEKQELKT